ncbi:hypothetical protein A9G13_01765 [Gilliamella sp. wkB178]|nr:hypothetical protein A9G13_01765 [Gilliamella apicola]
MHKKTVFIILFILTTILLAVTGSLAIIVLVTNMSDFFSVGSNVLIYAYEKEECLSMMYLSATILCIDLLLLWMLFLIFKKRTY